MTDDLFAAPAAAPIKALTLHQPWASLMAWGVKTIETRGWATAYRGPLAIHAAKTIPPYARRAVLDRPTIIGVLQGRNIDPANLAGLPLGAVVAIVNLVDCKPIEDLGWLPYFEYIYGNFAPGRFGWITRNVRALDPPIPARGHQGLWDWVPPLHAGLEGGGAQRKERVGEPPEASP